MRLTVSVVMVALWCALSATSVSSVAAQAPDAGIKATLAIVGGTLIDGHGGRPLDQAVVLVDGNRIVAIGTRATLQVPDGADVVDAGGMTIMPGLIDGHIHLEILGSTDYPRWHELYNPRIVEVVEVGARLAIMSGVTTVLDIYGPPEELSTVREKIDRGEIPGPRIKASMGTLLHPSFAQRYVGRDSWTFLVSTPEEARAAAQKALGNGADFINVMEGLTEDQMRVVGEEARTAGVGFTGVVWTPEDAVMRVNAGMQNIDHMGSLFIGDSATLDPALVKALLANRASIVPTLWGAVRQIDALEWPDYYINNRRMALWTPPEIWAEIRRTLHHPERIARYGQGVRFADADIAEARFRALMKSGVRLRVGTDTGSMYTLPTEAMWQEMDLMVEYGMPPQEVIAAATRRNAEWLGMLGDLGTVTEGKLADIIVVDGNPLVSMRDLRHVVTVIKDGKVLKGTAVSPDGR